MTESRSAQKIVIVGGVAAGASAATRARRLGENDQIILFEKGPDVSFANCGMPYFIGQEIKERAKLLVVTPKLLRERFRLDVRTQSEVVAIDRDRKVVRVRELTTDKEFDESYDKLVLAPGASPFVPPLPGIELPGIETLRNLGDMDRIKARIDQGIERAVVIGGGFIGLELIENFHKRGVAISLIERGPQILPPLDPELTAPLLDALASRGVDLHFETVVTQFSSSENGIEVHLSSGLKLTAQLVVLGAGVRPENRLAQQCGLALGERGGVRVDSSMITSDPNIYAAGDVVETYESITDTRLQVPLAGPANRQGRIIADQINGRDSRFRGSQCTAILGLFDQVAAITGFSEKEAAARGLDYATATVHPANHAGYYPGAQSMTLKIVFDRADGTLLGAQAVGGAGVDKRIDVLAIAIQGKMKVYDLEEVELCYAPQFGSAKDPVNMIGFVAAGMLRGDHPQISVPQLAATLREKEPLLIDVRTTKEYKAGTIDGAINVPVDELRDRLATIPDDRPLLVFCKVGQRGYIATRILLQAGRQVTNLSGGYTSWQMFSRVGRVAK